MPNDEHLAVLQRGVAAWNAWRAEHSKAPDLSRAGLRGLDLSRFDLSGADLRGADLRGTNCSDANLAGAEIIAGRWACATPDPPFRGKSLSANHLPAIIRCYAMLSWLPRAA